jgi:hypothetical protein
MLEPNTAEPISQATCQNVTKPPKEITMHQKQPPADNQRPHQRRQP